MSIWNKVRSLFAQEDIQEEGLLHVPVRGESGRSNIIPLNAYAQQASHEVVVMHPHTFNDALMAVHFLKSRCVVVINVTEMSPSESQRLVDFVSGSTFALDGSHERVGDGLFILTPSHIGIRTGSANQVHESLFSRS